MLKTAESYTGTQAVNRAIRLLKTFDSDRPEWSLADLVAEVELNKTTVFRLLTALESEGLVEKTANGNYRLGSELVALGGRAMRHNPLHQVAHPYLQQLAHATGERVTLEALTVDRDGRYAMLVLDEIPSVHMLGVNQFVGSRLPVHATSTGKAVLAFLPAAEQELILHTPLPKLTEQTRHTAGQLQTELADIRQNGYALAMSELEVGLMAASAPIFSHNQESYTAVCIVGPSVRLSPGRLLELAELVKQTALYISHQLGYRRS